MAALDQTLKANPEEGAVEAFTDTLQRRTTWMANTPEDTGPATANLIKDLSNPKMTQGLTSITDPSLISELDTAVNSYKPILKNALDSFKKSFLKLNYKLGRMMECYLFQTLIENILPLCKII